MIFLLLTLILSILDYNYNISPDQISYLKNASLKGMEYHQDEPNRAGGYTNLQYFIKYHDINTYYILWYLNKHLHASSQV